MDKSKLTIWLAGILPLVLLAGLVYIFFVVGPAGIFEAAFPPIEELTVERIHLKPNEMVVHVVNGDRKSVV